MTLAKHDRCRVCGQDSRYVFTQTVLGEPVDYFDCAHCGYFQTEAPDWLEQAYAEPINAGDTGMLMRNASNVGKVAMTLLAMRRLRGTVVDHAGGYGILVRLLRDAGIDAYWSDLYCQNVLARGFDAGPGPFDLLTAFEVLEHLVDPLVQLRDMLGKAPVVLSTTQLITSVAPPAPDWWYLGSDHGQHVGFFRPQTLAFMAQALGCQVATNGRDTQLFLRGPVPAHWHALLRLGALWKVLTWGGLHSKTMSDAERIVRERRPAARNAATANADE